MSDLALSKSFEEKMKERLRDSFGELLSDEDLKKIIEKGIKDTFFTTKTDNSGYRSVTIEPFINTFLQEHLMGLVKEEVKLFFSNHKEEMSKHIEAALSKGIWDLFVNGFNQNFSNAFYQFGEQIRSQLIKPY